MKLKLFTALLTAAALLAPFSSAAEQARDAGAKRNAVEKFATLPLSFEPTESAARFLAHSGSYTVSVGVRESSVAVTDAKSSKVQALRFGFDHANPAARLEAIELQPGVTNYYLGQDSSKWRLGVKHYAKLREQGVYPGVDVVYYGDNRRLEFDFVVAPKADPSVIAMSFSGMEKLYKDANGDLVAELNGKSVRFVKPNAYQKIAGVAKPVAVDYGLAAVGNVRLQIGDYDKNAELIIDPVVSYVTYLGGSAADSGNAIAVDTSVPNGGVFVTGQTASANFPENPNTFGGTSDAFITKYSLDGTTYQYTTYSTILGGTSTDVKAFAQGNGIAVDSSTHYAYVAGTTNMADLPGTLGLSGPHSYQGGDSDAFIVILNADGTLQKITYLGGYEADLANAIAIDQATPPNVIVAGQTQSVNFAFPYTQRNFPGYSAFEAPIESNVAFVTKLDNNLDIASSELPSDSPGYIDPRVSLFAPAPSPAPNNCTSSINGPCFFFSEFFGGQTATFGPAPTAGWSPYTPYPQYAIVADTFGNSQMATNAGCSGLYYSGNPGNPIPDWSSPQGKLTIDGGDVNDTPEFCGETTAPITWVDLGPLPTSANPVIFHNTAAYGVAVDHPGDVFVVGGTDTNLFPYTEYVGSGAWILKVSGLDGSDIYSTVLETNTSNDTVDAASAVAVDSQGRAYVTGTVTGSLLKTTANSYQQTVNSGTHAFLDRMTLTGGYVDFATYLGGSGNDTGSGVAVDNSGAAYVTGSTTSPDFPTIDPIVSPSNKLLTTLSGSMDAFVTKFSPATNFPTFSTYLGGSVTTQGNAIAVDPVLGDMYLTGTTASSDLASSLTNPKSYTVPQPQYGGGDSDAFVIKVAASGAGMVGLGTISISPNPVAFGNQTVNTSQTLSVTLTNTSQTAPLTISQILPSVSTDFTVDYSNCNPPTTLAASTTTPPPAAASCTVKVTYAPQSVTATAESASFVVDGNATNLPQTVNITGTAVAAGTGTGGSSEFTITANNGASTEGVSVTQGNTAQYDLSFTPQNGFSGSIALTCSGPAGSNCSFNPSSLKMNGTSTQNVSLYVNTNGGNGTTANARFGSKPIFLALLPFSIMGMLLVNKRRGFLLALALVLLCLLFGMVGCGAGGSSSSGVAPGGPYPVTVTATPNGNSSLAQTITLSLTVTPQ